MGCGVWLRQVCEEFANPLRTPAIEAENVHQVYETIASHWNHTPGRLEGFHFRAKEIQGMAESGGLCEESTQALSGGRPGLRCLEKRHIDRALAEVTARICRMSRRRKAMPWPPRLATAPNWWFSYGGGHQRRLGPHRGRRARGELHGRGPATDSNAQKSMENQWKVNEKVADCLTTPLRAGVFDAVLSIAAPRS